MASRLITAAVLSAALSGCASIGEALIDAAFDAAVDKAFSPLDGDRSHKQNGERSTTNTAWVSPAVKAKVRD